MEKRDSSTTGSQASEQEQKFDVFPSHSGKQKNFVRQLHRDLQNQGVSCFFDEDRDCLPLAQRFPPRIFEAINTCQVVVLLLSNDFLGSKWPMLELSKCVEVRDKKLTNPNLTILPLFFLISPDALKNIEEIDKKWQRLEISGEKRDEWQEALKAIRPINGFRFGEGGDEVKFRGEIVKEIWHVLPTPSPRYSVCGMQGEARMCQEVANFFNKFQLKKGGVRIVGLYAIPGHGKTTLCKAFCNFKLGEFEGKVCHLEFGRGDPFERAKLALRYLTHCPHQLYVTNEDEAKVEFRKRVRGTRVLLVLDNITEESMEEVGYYLKTDFGGNSWFLLSAQSREVLEKYFQIDRQSCMHVPRLTEDEAVTILLGRAFPVQSSLKEENTGFALKCARRLFKEVSCDNGSRARIFHPLALKAFRGYLMGKHGFNLEKWVAEIDDMVYRPGDGLDQVYALLDEVFYYMDAQYRTIFMLLTLYILPNMSRDEVIDWMAINCNENISFIANALQGLQEKAFIEEIKPEIRIHDLYIEFAQRKADKMERWLWWKKKDQECSLVRGLIPQNKGEFELAKFEQCRYRRVNPKYIKNLLVLQLFEVENMSKLDTGPMNSLRSITLSDCRSLEAVDGMEELLDLQWLQITGVHPMFKLPELSKLEGLQYLHIDIAGSQVLYQLGDLTRCYHLKDIYVVCPSLREFPRLTSMKYLDKVKFSLCDNVKGPLDCTDCVKLQTIVLSSCCQMAASPLLAGCEKLSKLVLSECHAVTTCPDVEVPTPLKTLELVISSKASSAPRNLKFYSELENLQLWNLGELMELPSFERLSNLTVLKLGKCGIREPPDLTSCKKLQNVYFFSLRNLRRLPNLSLLKQLMKLSLCDCIRVKVPPDIEGCNKLQVFHLLYNDNMRGLPKMDKCAQLEEIQVSWRSVDEVTYKGIDPERCEVNEELEYCLEYWKDEKYGKVGNVKMPEELKEVQCVKGKTLLVKRYFRGVKLYYSLTSPYVWFEREIALRTPITRRLMLNRNDIAYEPECEDDDWLYKVREYLDEIVV